MTRLLFAYLVAQPVVGILVGRLLRSSARSYPPAPGATSEPAGPVAPFDVRAPGRLHLP